MTFEQRLRVAADYLYTQLQINAPKRTWNLTYNGIHLVNERGYWEIVIGGEPAPYAVFTNESWNIGNTWKVTRDTLFGKKVAPYEVTMTRKSTNPNEHWINKTIEANLPIMQELLSGSMSDDEIKQLEEKNYNNQSIIDEQANQFIANINAELAMLKGERL